MEEGVRRDLLEKTAHALYAEDWDLVERIWQPWTAQGDTEAEFQVAYHYFCCPLCKDDITRERMNTLMRSAAAKDHPDALWYAANFPKALGVPDAECYRLLVRAGELGSVYALHSLGVAYATGDWTGPRDLAEAARWYRRGAEKGNAACQYDLGLMLLYGEGEPQNVEEGLVWLERAGKQEESMAYQVLVDCYENGYCGAPRNADKAAFWRHRKEAWEHCKPTNPRLVYIAGEGFSRESLERLSEINGVSGLVFFEGEPELSVFFEPRVISAEDLNRKIRASGIALLPTAARVK